MSSNTINVNYTLFLDKLQAFLSFSLVFNAEGEAR